MDAETQRHGLATVFGIIRQSKGFIAVDSAPGRGTTFRLYLPVTGDDATHPPLASTARVTGGMETLLLAEDQPQVRTLLRDLLKRRGYEVLAAGDAAEALELARQHAGPIHMLLTDMVMPGISGRELADRLSVDHPELIVLYMSGYTEDPEIEKQVGEGRAAFLAKPVRSDLLLRRIRELFDAR